MTNWCATWSHIVGRLESGAEQETEEAAELEGRGERQEEEEDDDQELLTCIS